jgi:hypothetical protein
MIVIGGSGSRRRARMLRTTSAEWTPSRNGFQTGRFHGRQPVTQHRGENGHHLPVAIGGAAELAADAFQSGWQNPILERRAVP